MISLKSSIIDSTKIRLRRIVAVVGGGPTGTFCALELAKRGVYATIFDHSNPREKPAPAEFLP